MKMNIKSLWLEPLLHFLFIGVALFMFYNLTSEQGSEAPIQAFLVFLCHDRGPGQPEFQIFAGLNMQFYLTGMRPADRPEIGG